MSEHLRTHADGSLSWWPYLLDQVAPAQLLTRRRFVDPDDALLWLLQVAPDTFQALHAVSTTRP